MQQSNSVLIGLFIQALEKVRYCYRKVPSRIHSSTVADNCRTWGYVVRKSWAGTIGELEH